MNNIINLIRSDLREFNPYASARDEAENGAIWLNANESPYANEFPGGIQLNRYPEKQPRLLLAQLADFFAVTAEQLALTHGSDEIIDLLVRLFCCAGKDAVMVCPPTFGMYSVCARLQGARVVSVPLLQAAGYQLDLPSILSAWNPSVKIIFICSPNNPTGNLIHAVDILYLCQQLDNKCLIVVDEAYIDYSNTKGLSHYINEYENLVILRTFSKAYGLAGARCGVVLAAETIVQWILKIMMPYPLSALSINVIADCLLPEKIKKMRVQIESVKAERARLFDYLSAVTSINKVWPSDANYLFIEAKNAKAILNACDRKNIVLRSLYGEAGLENYLRVTVGLPEENTQLINALREI